MEKRASPEAPVRRLPCRGALADMHERKVRWGVQEPESLTATSRKLLCRTSGVGGQLALMRFAWQSFVIAYGQVLKGHRYNFDLGLNSSAVLCLQGVVTI